MRAAAGWTATGRARPATLERVAKSDPIDRNQERHDPSRWRMPGVGSRFRLDQQERALKLFRTLTAAGAIAAATIAPALAVDISGAGATFPYPIYAKWADAYKKETGIGLNYQSIGSGGGIKQIQAKTVTFGASDMPLKAEELDKAGLVQFPMVMGGIVPVVNLDGIEAGRARARRPDARQDLPRRDQEVGRPGDRRSSTRASSCPTQAIVVVHRSDGSGTTFIFTDYLVQGQPGLEVARSAPTPRSNGRSASAPRATKASPTTSARPRARSATSNTPTPSRTS